jgi:hypothetical protein
LVADDDKVETTVKKLIQRVHPLHTAVMTAPLCPHVGPQSSKARWLPNAPHYKVIYPVGVLQESVAQERRNLPADGHADLIWSKSKRRAVKPRLRFIT